MKHENQDQLSTTQLYTLCPQALEKDNELPSDSQSNSMSQKGERENLSAPEEGVRKKTAFLDQYGRCLNLQAQKKMLDPIHGREEEILRIQQILSRKRKNNPLLVGDAGVGKTAIIEGLAQKIVDKEVPLSLINKKIYAIELSTLLSGTMYRGQFEERMNKMIQEVRSNPDIILYIDEIHTIMNSGKNGGSLDAANILKPVLARGEIKCIGATTHEEYQKTIATDGAMDRRFQKINISVPTEEETLKILETLKSRYEEFHGVTYSPEALKACVRLTAQYITDRFFPDKAIDAMDEAGAKVSLEYLRNIDIHKYDQQLAFVRAQKLKAAGEGNYEEAAKYREEQRKYQYKIEHFKEEILAGTYRAKSVPVEKSDVETVVSLASGVPVSSFTKDDLSDLKNLASRLRSQVKGQDHVIDIVASSIQRNKIGLRDPSKPIGTFFFLGSSGVGKTHLSKKLAKELFGSEDAMIRIDMSEFMESHSVARLIGAPPGYIGHGEGGELTSKVKKQPYSVVLLDEIEKAHPDIQNILLQILDDGVLTDTTGRKVNFKNTLIIMTSNVGTRQLSDFGTGIGFRYDDNITTKSEDVLKKALKRQFTPEFLNRIDQILTFNALSKEIIQDIVNLELTYLQERIKGLGFTISISEEVKEFIAEKGYDPQLGARPLKRAIAQYIEATITQAIIDNIIIKEHPYTLTLKTTIRNEVNVVVSHKEECLERELIQS